MRLRLLISLVLLFAGSTMVLHAADTAPAAPSVIFDSPTEAALQCVAYRCQVWPEPIGCTCQWVTCPNGNVTCGVPAGGLQASSNAKISTSCNGGSAYSPAH